MNHFSIWLKMNFSDLRLKRIELFFLIYDSKELNFFSDLWLKELNFFFFWMWLNRIEPFFFFNMTQRFEPFFECDSKILFFEYDSKKFFLIWLQELNTLKRLTEQNLLNTTPKIEHLFFSSIWFQKLNLSCNFYIFFKKKTIHRIALFSTYLIELNFL